VDAVAEREVVVDLAVNVESVAVGELPLVPICRTRQQGDGSALRDDLAVDLYVPGDVAGLAGDDDSNRRISSTASARGHAD
jgi:hypothetical protein